jgi:hypothetical protein
MKKLMRVLVVLPSILFVVTGLRWLVDPATAAAELGMTLLDGVGRSTQIGDLSAFFLTLGICMLIAVITARRAWFYPPMILLALAAFGRIIAWLIHDAALAMPMIVPEAVVAGLLFAASRVLADQD